MTQSPISIGGQEVKPGQRLMIELDVGRLYTNTEVTMPVQVIHGKHPGPVLFVSAAIHGDEITGVEIIRQLLKKPALKKLHGTLIAIPIVNVHGFINKSRYLPDRRDLNRSFPGSKSGSLAARLANFFMEEIVSKSTYGIDLHSGAIHRVNLPQIRANLDDPNTLDLAKAFGIPVLINSDMRDGSLRQAATVHGIPMLVYESGEALRFDEMSAKSGVQGVLNVMRFLNMLPESKRKKHKHIEPFVARSSNWVRAPESGIVRIKTKLGMRVNKGDRLCIITDPFGVQECVVESQVSGIIIGMNNLPLVNEGEALFNIARFENIGDVAAQVEELHDIEDFPSYTE
ncbi:MAG: succinylglutamate desuccinylase/aspartoacylase family protein [Gammaproteobacteria bacterium]|nr:succinylglutamate desuccinylase/aspartoacylase family protein [Gammaproteobacteria bacterium]